MSVGFGFSIGDIVLMSQLAYRLYSAVEARKSVSKELKNLGNALFDLHCALDHLGKTADEISTRALSGSNTNASVRKSLHSMIDSCASTLNELDEATKKYRDIDAQAEVDKPDSSGSSVAELRRQSTIERWKQQLKVQWNKVHWDFKESSMIEYRQRLLYHTATINMVMSTFIWSATDHLEASSQEQKIMLQALKDQGIQLNDGIMELVERIRKLMLNSASDSFPGSVNTNPASGRKRAFHGEAVRRPRNDIQFPRTIQSINAYQTTTGATQHNSFHQNYTTSERNPQSSVLKEGERPSIEQLRHEINFLFRSFHTHRIENSCLDTQGRQEEIRIWVNSLDDYLDFYASLNKMAEGARELVELLIDLNRAIERSNNHVAQSFFEGAKHARLDLVFGKLRLVSRSVRCVKEIEDFEDTRMEREKGLGQTSRCV